VNIPLWRQLHASAAVLQAVRAGRSMTAVLDGIDSDLRPGVQALSFQTLRWLGRAEALRRQLARRAPPVPVDALLCTALALIWRADQAPYEAFTLVDQAVEAARRHPATRAQASFVNACLRRFLREREALVTATDSDPVATWNHPVWWISRLKTDHPDHWQAILRASQTPAPMTLRVNARKTTVPRYLEALQAAGLNARAVGVAGIQLDQPRPVQALPGFSEGWVSVQDAAAQLAAPLLLGGLDADRPLRILDACAAPGGKTAHLLELHPAAQVTALDVDPRRCERITQNLQRLGQQARVLAADAGDPAAWWDGQRFDAILLDAPCTASGIGRRHPDVRWLRRESDITQLAAIQSRLLQALWPLLQPGGRLLYCTCSVFRAEGQQQIETFVTHNTDAVRMPSPGHLMPQNRAADSALPDNESGEHDGFFYALLEKRAA
jgi:16S rRNA (cytosine967-C5)-methyltransferase